MRRTESGPDTRDDQSGTRVHAGSLCGGVLSVAISGPVTAGLLLDIKREVMANAPTDLRAFFADYRRAIVAMDGAGLDAVLAGEEPGAGASLPAALLVSAANADLFMGHARRMAFAGHARRVFLNPANAMRWARDQARLVG